MAMRRGLTLIEILIAVAIVALLLGTYVIVANPLGLFARARNSQRTSHINAILNAAKQNIADNRTGIFSCVNGDIPTSSKRMASASSSANYSIAPCLIPYYLTNLPFDPATSSAYYASTTDYDTAYYIMRNASSGEVTVNAPAAELGQTISVTR